MREPSASSRGLWVRSTHVPFGFRPIQRALLAGLLLVVGACRADLPQDPPQPFVTVVFDPQTSEIPLPNDLVFLSDNLNAVCPQGKQAPGAPACAQAELLAAFNGFFPNDQQVPITIEFTQTNFDADGNTTQVAPDLDLASFTASTFFAVTFDQNARIEVELEPITAADYVKSTDRGTLTLRRKDRLPWAPGSYAVLVRGGADGVKTTSGLPVHASQVFHLVAQSLDMTDPANLGLLRAQFGSLEEALELGQQLNLLINLVFGPGAFKAADDRFPHQQLAIAVTFKISGATNVPIDPARSLVPLPIDLLRDPTTNRLTQLAACTLAGAPLNAAGMCTSPAAAGFLALDGFATTGAILAQPSELIQASTVTPDALRLYDLSNPLQPARVDPTTLLIQPCELNITGCGATPGLAPVIAIQPAGASAGDPTSVFRTKPLKDNTDYAVVITTDIKDRNSNAIAKSTAGAILAFNNPVNVGGTSQLLGVDDATTAGLERIRLQLQPVYAKAAAEGVPKTKIAIPYVTDPQTALPIAPTLVARTPDEAFTRFGVDKTRVPGEEATDNIDQIIEVDIFTFLALDPATGAFLPNPADAVLEPIHVLIATPKASNPNVPACQGPLAPFGKCAPMMVFRHGLGRGRLDMLGVADSYAKAGMVTVAIDAAKHGDRSFCTSGTSGAASGCVGGAACTTELPTGAQGDVNPPGTCGAAGFIKSPVSPTCDAACATAATDGIPVVSANYLVSANFFRTRDSLRQDLIDQSQLVRALAFVPSGQPPTGHAVFDHIITRALQQTGTPMIIDPGKIFYSGQSLGAIQGAMNVATNPRISKAALNVGGGTIVDVFTNSPAFTAQVNELLAGLGIQRGTARFLQFLVVTKTILDPADPINFAGHLTANTLPNLLVTPLALQAPKKILTQIANCDAVVPNPFSFVKANNALASPLPPDVDSNGSKFFRPGAVGTLQLFGGPAFSGANFGSCNVANAPASHGFLTDWTNAALATKAQDDIANFVMADTLPLTVQTP
jgi:hypothetical protein